MSIEEYQIHKDWFLDVYIDGKSWNQSFKQQASKENFDGWLNPEAFKIVERESKHEIAAHGFSHLLLSESIIEKSDFIEEMRLLKQYRRLQDANSKHLFILVTRLVILMHYKRQDFLDIGKPLPWIIGPWANL